MKIRTYSELIKLETFEERFDYLKLNGEVGMATFGSDRYLNQMFYRSPEWRRKGGIRDQVILRDNGCDLGVEGYDIFNKRNLFIHHMNPITVEDIMERREWILDPEYLICCSYNTHNAIHYGDKDLLPKLPVERKPRDTIFW